jgi:fumarylacetoacetase
MTFTNETHDPNLTSWVESANDPDTDFPIQNLPFGVFTRDDVPEGDARIGVAIGDHVLDLPQAMEERVLNLSEDATWRLMMGGLNDLMAAGREVWSDVRRAVSDLLREDNPTLRDISKSRERALLPISRARMELPCIISDYTDFYCSLHHATNVGSMFRPDNPLMPNWKHLPVGYHGRASSIIIDGTPVKRPMGQTKADDADLPAFGPCKLLDYEYEIGFFVGPGNPIGTRLSMKDAAERIFGLCIVNDWSARDIQKWEYQPLGPFNAKNFATTLSPWVVTLEALAPFRVEGPPRGADDPPTLEYMQPNDEASKHLGINLICETYIRSKQMREQNADPTLISRGSFADMYWTIGQMLVHHTSTGCNMRPGDLLASGTVSGPTEDARGCLLERTWRGQNPIKLSDGTERKFLQDGDEVIMRGICDTEGAKRIGFGECRGIVLPAE